MPVILALRGSERSAVLAFALAGTMLLGSTSARAMWAEQEAKLLASDGEQEDYFGLDVALDGDTAIIGAKSADHNGPQSGAAYVFTRTAGVWTELVKLLPSDGAPGDVFGEVALEGDTAIIGASGVDPDGPGGGAAYVFTRTAGVWTEQAKLFASDGASGSDFGAVIAIDGDTAILGDYSSDDNGANSGSAYVFTRTAGVWTEQARLLPADGSPGAQFGVSVDVDGDTAIIGAFFDGQNGLASGSAYVFTRTAGVWTQQAKLLPADGQPHTNFGVSVALHGDSAIIGAYEDDENGAGSGAAYVFTRTAGVWTEQSKLQPADGAAHDVFGNPVAIDNDTAIIGARQDDDNGSASGSAYVFARTAGVWTEQVKILASDGAPFDWFGYDIAFDGERAVIGAFGDDDNGHWSGSAYMFRLLLDCGDGILDPDSGEECDDGNNVPCDGCSSECTVSEGEVCGDGILNQDCGEECDDGNNDDGDGCSSDCSVEEDDGGDGGVPAVGGFGALLTLLSVAAVSSYILQRGARRDRRRLRLQLPVRSTLRGLHSRARHP